MTSSPPAPETLDPGPDPRPPARGPAPDAGFLVFRCGLGTLAVPLGAVTGLAGPGGLVRVPGCPPRILGLRDYRREAIPVVRLDDGDGRDGPERDDDRAILLLRVPQGAWGLTIDRRGISLAVEGSVVPCGPGAAAGPVAIMGSVRTDQDRFPLMDPARTWANLRSEVEEWYGRAAARSAAWEPGTTAIEDERS